MKIYTYFIKSAASGAIKIGRSIDPRKRLIDLQVASHESLELLGTMEGDHERDIHERFADLHIRGEWFRDNGSIAEFIETYNSEPNTDRLIRAVKKLIADFRAAETEVMDFWMTYAVSEHRPVPHLKAFDDGIHQLSIIVTRIEQSSPTLDPSAGGTR